jgi:CheY-like chemotaxis protein
MSDLEQVDVLLVEDSDADAEMTIRALKINCSTVKIARVRDGIEALDFIFCSGAYQRRRRDHPKLTLLDIKMPGLSGIDVLRRVKSDEHTKFIPVVMFTSSGEERDLLECYQLGVNSYLTKPVDAAAFTKVLSQACCYWTNLNRRPDDW